jgi:hypothetical protein
MGRLRGNRILTARRGRGEDIAYDYRDEFGDNRAAGAIDGTPLYPNDGSSLREVWDTESAVTISGGWLYVGPGTGYGNPGYSIDVAIPRDPGMAMVVKCRMVTKNLMLVGWDVNKTTVPSHAIFFSTSNLLVYDNGAPVVGTYSADTEYDVTVIQRSAGCHYFIRGGTDYPETTLVYSTKAGTGTPLYPRIIGNAAYGRFGYVRIPSERWLPTPLVSDGFSSWGTSDGLGHVEGGAALGAGGGGQAWNDRVGTWTAAAGVASASALDGGLALATCSAAADVNLRCTPTRAGGECGVVVRYADSDNYVAVVHDGTDLILRKVIAGVPSTVGSYTAAIDEIMVHAHAQVFAVYLGGTRRIYLPITDSVVRTAPVVGLISTNTGNTFDDFSVWSRT